MEVQKENRTLSEEISELKSKALVIPDGNARWEKQPDGSYYGPLCDACWGFKGSRIKLHFHSKGPNYCSYFCNHHPNPVMVDVPIEVLAKYGIDSQF